MDIDFNALYVRNSDFKAYVDKYCVKHKCSVTEAIRHYLIRVVGMQYKEQAETVRKE